jgi:hypothetical protein
MNRLPVIFSVRTLFYALLATVCLSSCSVTRKYTKDSTARWEKDIVQFEQLDKAEQDPDDAILFAGSSSIRLWSTLKEDLAPYPVIQRGFGGSKFSDFAVYTKRIVYPHNFRALVIFEANDITGSKADKSPEEVAKLFRKIVRIVRKKYADQPIFVVAITPTSSRWKVWPIIRQTNELLKESCGQLHNTWFIDTETDYLNKEGEPRKELFTKDNLHQNREGYLLWGELIRKKLDEVLR